MTQTIGILGAGKVGIVLAQLAVKAGYKVLLSASGDPEKIVLTTKILVPGGTAVTNEIAARDADIVILALPLSKYHSVPVEALTGKVVIDAMNYWDEVDGPRDAILPDSQSTSELVQAFLPKAHVVKALSHMGYHELLDFAGAEGDARKAIAIAGDSSANIATIAAFITKLGFTPLPIGPLQSGYLLEPGGPGFGASLESSALTERLGISKR